MTFPLKIVGLLKSKTVIPRNGLIHEILMDGNSSDTSGNGNDGIVSGATLQTGKDGVPSTAYEFTAGTLSQISYGDPVELRDLANNDFSVSIWVNDYDTFSTSLGTIWSSFASNNGILIRTQGTVGSANRGVRVIVFFSPTFALSESSSLPVITGQWNNIIITFDSSTKTISVHVNGTEISYATKQSGSGSLASDLGVNKAHGLLTAGSSAQTLDGKLTLHRIYNRILTGEEITILASE